jgi:SP family sugar:H+ symporter-like MFS transporter
MSIFTRVSSLAGVEEVSPRLDILFYVFNLGEDILISPHSRQTDAIAAATRIFSTPTNNFDAAKYIADIQLAIESERNREDASRWSDLTRGPDLRRLLIAVGIQSLQQAQGSAYMNSYIVSFLTSTGVTNVFPVIMGLYTLYYVAILTGHFLPDTVGRRPILICTATFCGVCLLIVSALVVAFKSPSDVQGKASIALIFLWEISFGVQSPLIWITTAEAAPSRNREKVQSIATFFGFGVSLLITSVSPYIQDKGYGNLGGRIVSSAFHPRQFVTNLISRASSGQLSRSSQWLGFSSLFRR